MVESASAGNRKAVARALALGPRLSLEVRRPKMALPQSTPANRGRASPVGTGARRRSQRQPVALDHDAATSPGAARAPQRGRCQTGGDQMRCLLTIPLSSHWPSLSRLLPWHRPVSRQRIGRIHLADGALTGCVGRIRLAGQRARAPLTRPRLPSQPSPTIARQNYG